MTRLHSKAVHLHFVILLLKLICLILFGVVQKAVLVLSSTLLLPRAEQGDLDYNLPASLHVSCDDDTIFNSYDNLAGSWFISPWQIPSCHRKHFICHARNCYRYVLTLFSICISFCISFRCTYKITLKIQSLKPIFKNLPFFYLVKYVLAEISIFLQGMKFSSSISPSM